ncbi:MULTISPECIES: hypothetical protein [Chromohalobacter]|jgi:hypothetical protein|uniref:Uncharacterized protein n=1 Tax=Chromohalobacter israelensis (strain ATCC BAA-138 / DSM 3043 / CIP 106854 / NCIMB 13768 / 1H11) TaxID=290398 RepID=Q1QT16_CHRI1|nr:MULTISPECIES: hypothetical protein [Chromohalobacter]ABE60392.1 hypothetical protein Csal_3048 [Chromohalobacter salexigens DSM 3043]MBZ5876630.1 hypothetical protein [Chromohalobacter salexigens]MDO0946256.1 hypothetical protein [Chromohalobacter salexigens]NQY45359.1 hypothetical protein [Chromohalobacter sp.]NWO56581.1 hypothetical protein [Chromohalobacter salexigens]
MRSEWLKKLALMLVIGMTAFGVVACDNDEGPAEEAGESVDDAMDNAGDSMEDAGEDIQDAAEDAQN